MCGAAVANPASTSLSSHQCTSQGEELAETGKPQEIEEKRKQHRACLLLALPTLRHLRGGQSLQEGLQAKERHGDLPQGNIGR